MMTGVQESNKHLEDGGGESVLQCVLDMLARTDTAESSFEPAAGAADARALTVVGRAAGFPVRLQARLRAGSALDFYHAVTHPLLAAVQDLRASETTLCKLLTDKDKEIEEYKAEGGQLLLKFLKTAAFDERSHRAAHPACARSFGADAAVPRVAPPRAPAPRPEPARVKLEVAGPAEVAGAVGAGSVKCEAESRGTSPSSQRRKRKSQHKLLNL